MAIRTYDTDGKVTQIDSAGLHTYGYDDAFRITGITDAVTAANSWTYGYDLLDRLSSATKTGTTIGYAYDANGNRLTQTGTSASTYTVSTTSDRLSSISGALTRTYSYDNAGNTTGDGSKTFVYNNRGRMKSTTNGTLTWNYTYNALGQRIKKTGTARLFVYDEAGHLLGEYTTTGVLVQETIWMGDIPVATIRPATSGVDVFYVHTDHLNTPRKVSQPSDNKLRWRWDPKPFGDSLPIQNPQSLGTFVYQLRFPGQYFDPETGLHYNYYRDFDPSIGRYVQNDPARLLAGTNTYAYVGGNPLTFSDPRGLSPYAGVRGAWWLGVRIGGLVNLGIEAATGATLGALLYDACHDSEEERCAKVLKGCREKCLDTFVNDPDSLPGMGTDLAGRQRRCIRECMESQNCFDF